MTEPVDVVEALLFASEAPVEAERIQEVLDLPSAGEARELVRVLGERLDGQVEAEACVASQRGSLQNAQTP